MSPSDPGCPSAARLMGRLSDWLAGWPGRVDRAYLATGGDRGLTFVVIQAGKRFDPEFQDSITGLDVAIANDPAFDTLRLSVLLLPYCSDEAVASFASPPFVLVAPRRPEADPAPVSPSPSPARHPQPEAVPSHRPWTDEDDGIDAPDDADEIDSLDDYHEHEAGFFDD